MVILVGGGGLLDRGAFIRQGRERLNQVYQRRGGLLLYKRRLFGYERL